MATARTSPRGAPAPARVLPESGYLTAGARVGIRDWHRRKDRSAIASWPGHDQPASWSQIETDQSVRVSYAIDRHMIGLVGRITLRALHLGEASTARLGIYLHPQWCGLGLGTEALMLFCDYQLSRNLDAIRLDVATANQRAVKCYQRCGWQVVDVFQRGVLDFFEMEIRCTR